MCVPVLLVLFACCLVSTAPVLDALTEQQVAWLEGEAAEEIPSENESGPSHWVILHTDERFALLLNGTGSAWCGRHERLPDPTFYPVPSPPPEWS